MKTLHLLPLFALLACSNGDDTDPADGPPLDPDAMSWSPASFPPAQLDRVVFLGDSITFGYGINTTDNQYKNLLVENNDRRWPDFTGDDLTGRFGAPEVLDASRNGAETDDLVGQIDTLRSQGTDGHTAVFVTIGGNDLVGALTTPGALDSIGATVEANIAEAVDELQALYPDSSVLFTNVYEPTDGEGQTNACFMGLTVEAAEPALQDTNGRLLALAKDREFAYVDLRGHFLGHGHNHARETIEAYDSDDPTLWLQDDCIHPNARGHHELRRLFLAALDNQPLELWYPE